MQKSGHFANACPETCTVQGGNPSKLPGVSSFSMHVVTNVECLRELADTTESLDQLDLGSCELMIKSFMIEQSDDKHRQMGDPLARRAEHVLAMSTPFPEDDTSPANTYQCNRFTVYQVNEWQHIICNSARLKDRPEGTLIWSYLLENWAFCLGKWYGKFISCHHPESKQTSRDRWMVDHGECPSIACWRDTDEWIWSRMVWIRTITSLWLTYSQHREIHWVLCTQQRTSHCGGTSSIIIATGIFQSSQLVLGASHLCYWRARHHGKAKRRLWELAEIVVWNHSNNYRQWIIGIHEQTKQSYMWW